MASPEDDLAAAVQALYRIRAVEQPPDSAGLKEVWHQCAQGADLVSFVDRKGHVVRQELSLLEDYFRWTSAEGLSTGASGKARGSKALRAGEGVVLDRATQPVRVYRANAALAGYQGADRYLKHVQKVIPLAAEGLDLHEEPTVTHVASVRPPTTGAAPAAVPARPKSAALWWLLAGVAFAVIGLVLGYVLRQL